MATETKHEDSQFDTMTDASSTTAQEDTPPSTPRALGSWNDRRDIPCPEETFQIFEKNCGKAITLVGDEVKLQYLTEFSHPHTHWHCVKQDGYFGFQNPLTGRYLGHNNKGGVHAAVCHLKEWELWTPREHRDGGYELLSPYFSHTLMVMCVDEDGSTLARRRHGVTLWEFAKV